MFLVLLAILQNLKIPTRYSILTYFNVIQSLIFVSFHQILNLKVIIPKTTTFHRQDFTKGYSHYIQLFMCAVILECDSSCLAIKDNLLLSSLVVIFIESCHTFLTFSIDFGLILKLCKFCPRAEQGGDVGVVVHVLPL